MEEATFQVVCHDATACSAGEGFSAVLSSDGALYTWGSTGDGRLGRQVKNPTFKGFDANLKEVQETAGEEKEKEAEEEEALRRRYTTVALGSDHGAAVDDAGRLHTWGNGAFGQLGHGRMDDTMLLASVAFFNRLQVTQVACGWSFTIALASDGAVYAWGAGGMGQLGRRNCLQSSTPKKVEGLEDHSVRLIACGENHAAVVTDAGGLLTWGCGEHGRLGTGSCDNSCTPTTVKNVPKCRSVACGSQHTACITNDGSVYVWGCARGGRLGIARTTDALEPERVPLSKEADGSEEVVVAISCGVRFTAAVTEDGKVLMWGLVPLGLGSPSARWWPNPTVAYIPGQSGKDHPEPSLVSSTATWEGGRSLKAVAVSCGSTHTLALLGNGRVLCWGMPLVEGVITPKGSAEIARAAGLHKQQYEERHHGGAGREAKASAADHVEAPAVSLGLESEEEEFTGGSGQGSEEYYEEEYYEEDEEEEEQEDDDEREANVPQRRGEVREGAVYSSSQPTRRRQSEEDLLLDIDEALEAAQASAMDQFILNRERREFHPQISKLKQTARPLEGSIGALLTPSPYPEEQQRGHWTAPVLEGREIEASESDADEREMSPVELEAMADGSDEPRQQHFIESQLEEGDVAQELVRAHVTLAITKIIAIVRRNHAAAAGVALRRWMMHMMQGRAREAAVVEATARQAFQQLENGRVAGSGESGAAVGAKQNGFGTKPRRRKPAKGYANVFQQKKEQKELSQESQRPLPAGITPLHLESLRVVYGKYRKRQLRAAFQLLFRHSIMGEAAQQLYSSFQASQDRIASLTKELDNAQARLRYNRDILQGRLRHLSARLLRAKLVLIFRRRETYDMKAAFVQWQGRVSTMKEQDLLRRERIQLQVRMDECRAVKGEVTASTGALKQQTLQVGVQAAFQAWLQRTRERQWHSKLEQIAHEKRQLAIRVRGLVDRLQQVEDVRSSDHAEEVSAGNALLQRLDSLRQRLTGRSAEVSKPAPKLRPHRTMPDANIMVDPGFSTIRSQGLRSHRAEAAGFSISMPTPVAGASEREERSLFAGYATPLNGKQFEGGKTRNEEKDHPLSLHDLSSSMHQEDKHASEQFRGNAVEGLGDAEMPSLSAISFVRR